MRSCPYEFDRFGWGADLEYTKRLSKPDDKLGGGLNVAWDADVVSCDGAHYHFWIPTEYKDDKEKRSEFLKKCKVEASWQGDPVSFSYSYIPKFKPIAHYTFTNVCGLVMYEYDSPHFDESELVLIGENGDPPKPYWLKTSPEGEVYFMWGELAVFPHEFMRIRS